VSVICVISSGVTRKTYKSFSHLYFAKLLAPDGIGIVYTSHENVAI
jgi:hypothetical protein